ncbi:DNA ligase D [Longimicrobium terrae]|uniref:DNA ligase (ATP) n=1 Tax=Longimicrobium terrae TaxID=1639882 RepID=A0A841H4S3_9BACT|nr:DNA ligase D [Longimicrobium terrae]MBB4638656.1 bifunctional non-homologous end joining protein LigD [Longimicrobium terrae]MBB6072896.1 bifunctional non-homologous end joining protein LigD [Longimicrobium terrae]NNC31509.1 DNA ligase D [Longimicrobium terrae]
MGLDEYKRKRDFRVTDEPEGHVHHSGDVLSFVIQKHAASHLHYDFRLELDGVLLSWAVPKGPSLDAGVKRLAIHVEDHPIEYGVFEGIIPRGEYGGGTVMLWDRGAWVPDEDPRKAYRKGHLRFRLDGERLHGGWHLVRSRRGADGEKEQWLLFKDEDDVARPESAGIITEEVMTSVDTGRTMEEIAADADAHWDSKAPAAEALIRSTPAKKPAGKPGAKKPAPAARKPAARKPAAAKKPAAKSAVRSTAETAASGKAAPGKAAPAAKPAAIPGAKRAAFPAEFTPALATLVDDVPAGDDWIHEIKYDGYRLVAHVRGGKARLITRNGNDWTSKFPEMATALSALPVRDAVLDGELVVLSPDGRTSFQALQNVLNSGRTSELVFYAFDLMHRDGMNLRGASLLSRKEALRELLAGDSAGPVRYSDHIVGNGAVFYQQACGMGLEGIISKRADSPYATRRTRDWLKVKCLLRQEFVIGGFTAPQGSRSHFGALLVGVHDENGDFIYSGKVGTGFNEASLRQLHAALRPLSREESPFSDYGRKGRRPAGVTWVEPKLVCEISFTEWTGDNILRHPVFQGLREDKPAAQVVRESAGHLSAAETPARPARAGKPTATAREQKPSATTRPVPPSTTKTVPRRGKANEAMVAGIRLTSPDKLLFPAAGITKLELARYYEAVADWMLPHVKDRPLTLVRCPDGVGGPCFFQKHGDEHFAPQVGRTTVTENDGEEKVYTYVHSTAGLVALVQMSVLEMHTSNAKRTSFEKPDRFIMDLDPGPGVSWQRIMDSALQIRDRLAELGLASFVKTTGGKGLHVVVPINKRHTWDEVKEFSRALATDISAANPGKYVTKSTIAARKGKIYIDFLRNGRGATAIAAFCIRARPSGAISVPLRWDELTPALRTDDFTPAAVIERVRGLKDDPWAEFWTTKQSLTKKMRTELGLK